MTGESTVALSKSMAGEEHGPAPAPQITGEPQAPVPITIAYGDGIGPEIMEATLRILSDAGARIAPERIEIGESIYRQGHSSGIAPESWESLRRTRIFLKAPITTPQGGGFKSLNVTIRKTLGLFANIRPCASYHPFIHTRHPGMDVVIVRENEEDLYAGIEHRQTDQVTQCLKLISAPGTEKIVRYAFEYARRNNRRKVTCFTKDNIMKLTDGLFHATFERIAPEYPELQSEHMIVDIGAARLADTPEDFDVIVTSNLYGDILSDVAAQISGSVGIGASANIGDGFTMFEAIHGSAPQLAGKDLANPSGLLLSAVMMLVHCGQPEIAGRIHNAWLKTIEDGIHTADISEGRHTRHTVGTEEFTRAVIVRLGKLPEHLEPVAYTGSEGSSPIRIELPPQRPAHKEIVGVDLFLHWNGPSAEDLASRLRAVGEGALALKMITNRGVKVWPNGLPETFCTDHWRCRFLPRSEGGTITHADIVALLGRVAGEGLDFIKIENLCTFDGVPGYSLGQGE